MKEGFTAGKTLIPSESKCMKTHLYCTNDLLIGISKYERKREREGGREEGRRGNGRGIESDILPRYVRVCLYIILN